MIFLKRAGCITLNSMSQGLPLCGWALTAGGYQPQLEVISMAKTKEGKKIVPVKPYTRKVGGKVVEVGGHRRSTPN